MCATMSAHILLHNPVVNITNAHKEIDKKKILPISFLCTNIVYNSCASKNFSH